MGMGVDVGIAGSIGLDGLRIDEKNESESERQKVSGSIIRYYQLMIGVRVVVIGAPIVSWPWGHHYHHTATDTTKTAAV